MPVTRTRCCPQQMGTDGKILILQITLSILRVIASDELEELVKCQASRSL